jgi:tetratricopeptide (TPR) repeat protein
LETIREKTSDTASLAKATILIDTSFSLHDNANEMRVYLIRQSKDEYPVPTKEYMVAYFPRQKVLVSGCLYNKPLTYHEVINQRKPALKRFVLAQHLDVQYLIPTNTDSAAGFENVCTMAMLDETLRKGLNPDSVSISLRQLSIEDLENKRDSLVAYFRARLPRSFDLLVLTNTLYQKYKDPNRGIQLAKVAATLFPNDIDVLGLIGDGYRLKRDYVEALAFYEKGKEVASAQSKNDWVTMINKEIEDTKAESGGPVVLK